MEEECSWDSLHGTAAFPLCKITCTGTALSDPRWGWDLRSCRKSCKHEVKEQCPSLSCPSRAPAGAGRAVISQVGTELAQLCCFVACLDFSVLWFLDVSLLSLWPGTGGVYKALGQQLPYHGVCSYLNMWRHCWDCKISMGKAGRRLHRDPRQSFLIYHYYCLPKLGRLCSSPEIWFVTSRGKKKIKNIITRIAVDKWNTKL